MDLLERGVHSTVYLLGVPGSTFGFSCSFRLMSANATQRTAARNMPTMVSSEPILCSEDRRSDELDDTALCEILRCAGACGTLRHLSLDLGYLQIGYAGVDALVPKLTYPFP